MRRLDGIGWRDLSAALMDVMVYMVYMILGERYFIELREHLEFCLPSPWLYRCKVWKACAKGTSLFGEPHRTFR